MGQGAVSFILLLVTPGGRNRMAVTGYDPAIMKDRVCGRAAQTWKLSPQPQRPFSLGLVKTNPVWNLSST